MLLRRIPRPLKISRTSRRHHVNPRSTSLNRLSNDVRKLQVAVSNLQKSIGEINQKMHILETLMKETERKLSQHHREHSLLVLDKNVDAYLAKFCRQYFHKVIMRLALIFTVWTIVFIIYTAITHKN